MSNEKTSASGLNWRDHALVIGLFVSLSLLGLAGWGRYGDSIYLEKLFAELAGCFGTF